MTKIISKNGLFRCLRSIQLFFNAVFLNHIKNKLQAMFTFKPPEAAQNLSKVQLSLARRSWDENWNQM